QFETRALDRVEATDTPDLLVHYHAAVSSRVVAVDTTGRPDPYYDNGVPLVADDTATLMIDMVDSRTGHLVWRGWAQTDLEGLVSRADRFTSKINLAVTRMFARLPGYAN